jgi:hypothetical protein
MLQPYICSSFQFDGPSLEPTTTTTTTTMVVVVVVVVV